MLCFNFIYDIKFIAFSNHVENKWKSFLMNFFLISQKEKISTIIRSPLDQKADEGQETNNNNNHNNQLNHENVNYQQMLSFSSLMIMVHTKNNYHFIKCFFLWCLAIFKH